MSDWRTWEPDEPDTKSRYHRWDRIRITFTGVGALLAFIGAWIAYVLDADGLGQTLVYAATVFAVVATILWAIPPWDDDE